ncbi:hypothetical protein [Paenibacillus thalictri]|uniref:DUF4179 domain-containing protein n=1 Tax=Paenibacillus thalictri TaxID=2527873 RepID=A0A4Q9DIY2_9BACL|nr:hypothetical protein [Paenibacillus thalictri]TBL70784.1 hypothetical protein EYB31_32715 [Paenibacillus thalictri]
MKMNWKATLATLMIASLAFSAVVPALAEPETGAVETAQAASDNAAVSTAAAEPEASASDAAAPATTETPAPTAADAAAPVATEAPTAADAAAPATTETPAPTATDAAAPAAATEAPAPTVAATAAAPVVAPAPAVYPLNGTVQAEVKSLSLSKSTTGTTIGAAVRLRNQLTQMNRVPDYELRVTTSDGSVYTLPSSATNQKSMLAKENADMTYMVKVDRQDDFTVTSVSFVYVDEYVYPKLENTLLTIPVTNVWNASKADITDPYANKGWGESFAIPGSVSPLRYATVGYSEQNNDKGRAFVVTLLVENTGTGQETMGGFRLDGKTDDKVFPGKLVEEQAVQLAPGEKKYVHVAIPVDNGTVLKSMFLMTSEMYTAPAAAGAQPQAASFDVGRLKIAVPAEGTGSVSSMPAADYTMGTPISVDPLSKLIDANTEVSLVELTMHGTDDDGYKTVVAKFKLNNKSGMTVAYPAFQTEIAGSGGAVYTGTRQNMTLTNLMPNLSYVVSYSFMVPDTEKGDQLSIRLLDNVTAAPYNTTLAALQTAVPLETDSDTMSFYPFTVKLNDWQLNAQTSGVTGQTLSYTYKMKLDLTVNREDNVVVDQNFSKFKMELVDGLGRTIGSQSVPFTGTNKLISGEQIVQFTNLKTDQLEYPLTINIYESIDTPNGEADRLVKTLKQ